jgi:hypothetical protein
VLFLPQMTAMAPGEEQLELLTSRPMKCNTFTYFRGWAREARDLIVCMLRGR